MSKREIILHHSLQLFSEKGYEQTSINEISTRSKLAKGLVYHYFPSKASILDAIVHEGISDVIKRFELLDTERTYSIEQILHHTLDVFRHFRDYWRLVYVSALNSDLYHQYSRTFREQIDEPYLQLVEKYYRSVGTNNPETKSLFFSSLVNGLFINILFRNVEIDVEVVMRMVKNL